MLRSRPSVSWNSNREKRKMQTQSNTWRNEYRALSYRWNGSSANQNPLYNDFGLGPQAWASAEWQYWSGTRLQLTERVSYNGILIWKVDEFEQWRKEAMEGVTLSLYSTLFFTSRHSYEMCTRAYLNRDGLGKGTHLNFFFFVIMWGPYDALLPWPFHQKVMLTLINQAGKKHQSDSFRPDPHSSSFQRPGRKEMNIASGCPMFYWIEHLLNGGFVKDDSVYLRVVVGTLDLPKIIPWRLWWTQI